MARLRRGRFVALATAGLVATGLGAVASAQTGVDLAATGALVSARVTGLSAESATLAPGHGTDAASGEPVTMIKLKDVGIRSVCIRLRSVDVPVIGKVTVVATLPEGAEVHADGMSIDARSLEGPMGLQDVGIGTGNLPADERQETSGSGLTARHLDSGELNVDVAGMHADSLTTTAIDVRAVRGEGGC